MENYYKKRHGIARLCGTEVKKKQKLNLSQQTVWAGLGCESEAPGKNKGKGSLFEKAIRRMLSGNTDKFSPIHEKAAVRRAFRE